MTVPDGVYNGFPSSESDEDVSKTKQQSKRGDKARDRSGKSSGRITDIKDTNIEKPSKQPGSLFSRIDESATGVKKPERKPYSSPDSKNYVEVKNTVELRTRLLCNCEGHIRELKETAKKFEGFQRLEVESDKDMITVIGSMERKELMSYLEKKLGRNLVIFPIEDYDNVIDECKEDEADGSAGNRVHQMEKVVELGAKGMHKEEYLSGGRKVRRQKATKKSKADSRVHPVNLDEQMKMNLDLSRNKTQSGINGDAVHHLENTGKRQDKVTKLRKFGLCCDKEYLEKTRQTAMNFEGVELARIDPSKGLIMVTGAVDRKRLSLYLKENLKRDVQVFPIQRNNTTGSQNKVLTNICSANHEQVKGDTDVVQWSQKLKDDAVRFRCGGDRHKHTGADEVNMKFMELAEYGNVNGAWRIDKLVGDNIDIHSQFQQNYGGESQFSWDWRFSDENTHSCIIM